MTDIGVHSSCNLTSHLSTTVWIQLKLHSLNNITALEIAASGEDQFLGV